MKVIKLLLLEVVIFFLTVGLGFGIDYIFIFHTETNSDVSGHPVPVFTWLFPLVAMIIIVIVNLLFIIYLIKRRKSND